jgi:ADP-ribose pyrophosphatase YjhB (NUDIX family)
VKTRREVSAGGVLLRPGERDEVLLAARRVRSGDLVWGLPKGLVEEGEPAEDAALREVREETGWEGRIVGDLGEIEYWYVWAGVRVHKIVRFFLMEAVGGDESLRDHEMEEVAWYPLADAADLVGFRSEREVVVRAAAARAERRPP